MALLLGGHYSPQEVGIDLLAVHDGEDLALYDVEHVLPGLPGDAPEAESPIGVMCRVGYVCWRGGKPDLEEFFRAFKGARGVVGWNCHAGGV